MNLKVRLAFMNFLQFAVWGAYLTCMGIYLTNAGMSTHIGAFFAMQGIVSIFMPALMGIVADRWIPAQRLLGLCHLLAGAFMMGAAAYGYYAGSNVTFATLFTLYSVSVKDFPPIRVFGTVGFICSMWFVDIMGFKANELQFVVSGVLSILLFLYTFTLPACPVSHDDKHKSLVDAFGLRAFTLFRQKKMAIFFIFSMLLGVSLQITNGFATPFIESFAKIPEFADTFGVKHSVILYSISQISETLCILMIPFFMKHFGIKNVMLIAMFAWVLRFGLLGAGDPGSKVWMFVASMIIYGVAFDFFNISGSLFVDKATDPCLRSSAQGLFMLMTNGLGATIGSLAAQEVVDLHTVGGVTQWQSCWYVFAGYALIVGVAFALIFRPKKEKATK